LYILHPIGLRSTFTLLAILSWKCSRCFFLGWGRMLQRTYGPLWVPSTLLHSIHGERESETTRGGERVI